MISQTTVTPFDFEGTPVRTVTYETGLTWWVLSDVANVLNIKNSRDLASRLDEDEKGVAQIDTPGGLQEITVINESGLYKIVLRSDKPEAKRFQRWVTHEVLPSIRQHGGYMMGQEQMNPEQMVLASMRWLESKVREQESQIQRMKPKEIFADSVSVADDCILVGDLAKLVRGNGIDIGQQRLFAWMRETGYLMRKRGKSWNMPTQKAMDLHLFEIKERTINQPDGTTRTTRTSMVTGKGQIYFINKFLNQTKFEGME